MQSHQSTIQYFHVSVQSPVKAEGCFRKFICCICTCCCIQICMHFHFFCFSILNKRGWIRRPHLKELLKLDSTLWLKRMTNTTQERHSTWIQTQLLYFFSNPRLNPLVYFLFQKQLSIDVGVFVDNQWNPGHFLGFPEFLWFYKGIYIAIISKLLGLYWKKVKKLYIFESVF